MDESRKKKISEALGALQYSFRQNNQRLLAAGGVTRPQLLVLRELFFSNGLSLMEISRKLGLSHSTVSGIVDRLEARGLVRRKRDGRDGRITRIFVTKPVLRHVEKMRGEIYRPIISAIEAASPGEQMKIATGLASLRKALEKATSQ